MAQLPPSPLCWSRPHRKLHSRFNQAPGICAGPTHNILKAGFHVTYILWIMLYLCGHNTPQLHGFVRFYGSVFHPANDRAEIKYFLTPEQVPLTPQKFSTPTLSRTHTSSAQFGACPILEPIFFFEIQAFVTMPCKQSSSSRAFEPLEILAFWEWITNGE